MTLYWSLNNKNDSNMEHVSTGLDHMAVSSEQQPRCLLSSISSQTLPQIYFSYLQQHNVKSTRKWAQNVDVRVMNWDWSTSKIVNDGATRFQTSLLTLIWLGEVGNRPAVEVVISLPQRMFERKISSCKSPAGSSPRDEHLSSSALLCAHLLLVRVSGNLCIM